MKLSVIIPTRNRAALLNETILSITKQTLPYNEFEVIVVDNGSTDNTKDIFEKYVGNLDIKYIFEPKTGLHEGRHAGLKAAKSEILVYIDDDIEAFPEWLETIYKVFQKDDKIVLVGGKNLPKYEIDPPFWILEMWNKRIEFGNVLGHLSILDFGDEEKVISPYYVFGCNFSIRKQVIIDAGGFHPDAMPFELIHFRGDGESYISEYIQNKKLIAYYHPLASIKHWVSKERMKEDYFYKRNYIQGISDAYTALRKNKTLEKSTHKKENKYFRYFKIISGIKTIELLNKVLSLLEKNEFEKQLVRSYNNGYNYLVNCYEIDQEIKNWVHKEKYLN